MLKLKDFHISDKTGFLMKNPLSVLPEYFQIWNDLASRVPELVSTRRMRDEVNKMPILDHNKLEGYREKRLAHLQLSLIGVAYVWQNGEDGTPEFIPEPLAIPWWSMCREVGLNPPLCPASVVLANWRILDPEGPFELDNLDIFYRMPGGQGAKWFLLLNVQCEHDFAPALQHIVSGVQCMQQDNQLGLATCLEEISVVISTMKNRFNQIHGKLKASEYYNSIRPFTAGWGGENSAIPDGLIFKGISEQPTRFVGGSFAQSTTFQLLDSFLGVCHTPDEKEYFTNARTCMPPDHRAFVEAIEKAVSLREYVKESKNVTLRKAYDGCLSSLVDFRSYHIQIATKYVVIPSKKTDGNKSHEAICQNELEDSVGTPFPDDMEPDGVPLQKCQVVTYHHSSFMTAENRLTALALLHIHYS